MLRVWLTLGLLVVPFVAVMHASAADDRLPSVMPPILEDALRRGVDLLEDYVDLRASVRRAPSGARMKLWMSLFPHGRSTEAGDEITAEADVRYRTGPDQADIELRFRLVPPVGGPAGTIAAIRTE